MPTESKNRIAVVKLKTGETLSNILMPDEREFGPVSLTKDTLQMFVTGDRAYLVQGDNIAYIEIAKESI